MISEQMTPETDEGDSPLHTEGQYSGQIYWLNVPTGYDISLENLRDQLQNHTFYKQLSDELGEDSTIEVPDVFRQDGEVVRTTSVQDVNIVTSERGEIVLGTIEMDDADTVSYRGKDILILDNLSAKFAVFKHNEHYYLAIIGKRELAEGIAAILKSEYDEFGSLINATRISPEALERIRISLDAKLLDTIISDYPQGGLTSLQIKGSDLEDEETYKRQKKRGKLKTHMYQTSKLISGEEKTIGVSRDGLVRIYSNGTIATYLRLLTAHILPHIHRDVESSPSIGAYDVETDDNPIYKKVPVDQSNTG